MKRKRGQVAMEFLMTYGWAIIIILLAVAALWYLGVFSPSTPNRCDLDAPFNCGDVKITNNVVEFSLGVVGTSSDQATNLVEEITINGVTCTDVKVFNSDGSSQQDKTFVNGVDPSLDAKSSRVKVSCTLAAGTFFGSQTDKASGQVKLKYENQNSAGIDHTVLGDIQGTIEE